MYLKTNGLVSRSSKFIKIIKPLNSFLVKGVSNSSEMLVLYSCTYLTEALYDDGP